MVSDYFFLVDSWMNSSMVSLHNPMLTQLMSAITTIGSTFSIAILSAILLSVFFYRKQIYNALLLVLSMSGGLLLKTVMKLIVQRARPENALVAASEYSFPSGHTMMAAILFLVIIYTFRKEFSSGLSRTVFIAGNFTLIFLIGFSRVYLNVHWLSDVIAGLVFGAAWFAVSVKILDYLRILPKKK